MKNEAYSAEAFDRTVLSAGEAGMVALPTSINREKQHLNVLSIETIHASTVYQGLDYSFLIYLTSHLEKLKLQIDVCFMQMTCSFVG